MGDNAAAGLLDKAGACECPGDDMENVPVVLLDPEPLVGYAVVLPFEYPEGCGCEGDDDDTDNVDCPLIGFPWSRSPLSDVAVVRLPPDPLRILTPTFGKGLLYEGGGAVGTGMVVDPPHSFPRAAACANTFRRDFLLFSNCTRAVSCNVSRVLNLESHILANDQYPNICGTHEYA